MSVATRLVGVCSLVAAAAALPAACSPTPHAARYAVVADWPHLPDGMLLGQVSGVGVDASGGVMLFRRAARDWVTPLPTDPIADPTILRFDAKTGALSESLGAGQFAMPHGLTIDAKGHLWVTDVALQQVFELDATGRVLLTLGERGVAGDDETHFNMPTDVAVADDGTFFVSDGYGNSRVVRFSPEGRFERSWGEVGVLPGQFVVPHGIALGPDGNVYVADRGNARVQIFDRDGTFVGKWESAALGRPWSIAFDADGLAFVVDGGDQPASGPDRARILEVDERGQIVGSFGSVGAAPGQMRQPHDIAVGSDGSVYVVEVGAGKRAQKFAPQP